MSKRAAVIESSRSARSFSRHRLSRRRIDGGVSAGSTSNGSVSLSTEARTFDASRQQYASPRIHRDLVEQKEPVSRERIIRLMQEDGLKARVRKRFTGTTMSDHDQPVADNLLDRRSSRPTRRTSAGWATRPSS
jgi:transposase InsO family protein